MSKKAKILQSDCDALIRFQKCGHKVFKSGVKDSLSVIPNTWLHLRDEDFGSIWGFAMFSVFNVMFSYFFTFLKASDDIFF